MTLVIYALLLAAAVILASAGRREDETAGAQGGRLGRKSLRRCSTEGRVNQGVPEIPCTSPGTVECDPGVVSQR